MCLLNELHNRKLDFLRMPDIYTFHTIVWFKMLLIFDNASENMREGLLDSEVQMFETNT